MQIVKKWLVELGVEKNYKVLNGANRTVDILTNGVDKSKSIEKIAELFNIPMIEIACSDDQGQSDQTAFNFLNHPLGFATRDFEEDINSTYQISTDLAFNLKGVEANKYIINNLKFKPYFKYNQN